MTTREKELKAIEQQLKSDLADAEKEIEQLDDQVRDFGETSELAEGADNHPGDDSDRLTEQQRLLTIRGQLAARKADIEHAIEKAASGEFGVCERCGNQIPSGRLEALPFARYCVDCQEILDRDGVEMV
ncbi:MAG: conjugal transfer protein TraR [Sphaerobacteraceae bacterium]|nr:MAG: conjugal transfer protein TraR [Sphaerobacteraceae bacterium]